MRATILFCIIVFVFSNVFSQEEIFSMQKQETNSISVGKELDSDTLIILSNIRQVSSLSISGKIELFNNQSLVRIILITKENEYLVYESYKFISDKNEFSINKVCEETSLLKNEELVEIIIVIRNAKFSFKSINYSLIHLNKEEEKGFNKNFNTRKRKNEKMKSSYIDKYNRANFKIWVADVTNISLLPFEKKKNLFGGSYDFFSGGYEYYTEGIFSFEPIIPIEDNFKSTMTSSYPSEFDWRNRHNEDWTTPTSLQLDCGSCTAFSAVAVTEMMTNLYFNDHLDLDLSEQEVWVCNSAGGSCSFGSYTISKLQYIRDHGVSEEACFPYVAEDLNTIPCSNKCSNPNELISFSTISTIGTTIEDMKHHIIFKGPYAGGVCFGGMNWYHAMAVIGYKVIEEGDYIQQVGPNGGWGYFNVPAGSPLIGLTYFIYKNSYPGNEGYTYLFFENGTSYMMTIGGIETPISSLNYDQNDILCVDKDHDGYYNWGIGAKPSHCPACPAEPDGDDSDPCLGPMDAYGNCQDISGTKEITSSETWTIDRTICGGLKVKNGGNLTVNGSNVKITNNNNFEVEIGGTFLLSEGEINF